ncbi:MAG: glycoside hydrolase family 5 protein [Fibrobacter sp.]|jgi:aryl-phospho-beta-D-glucosidase BglC (GH1 family)|nr:glycoside hydrolase family 5 protein [Fibrobacter sp.]
MRKLPVIILLFCSFIWATPVSDIGALQVVGNEIRGENGEVAHLRGMSLYWSQSRVAKDFYNENTVSYLAEDWNVNVIRAAMAVSANWADDEKGYIADPVTQKNRINAVVQAAIDLGIYVIIDFHEHNAGDFQSQAITFFQEMATQWGTHPNVIYEIWNEPIGNSDENGAGTYWNNTIKPYSEALISAIRAIDPDNLIVLGTPFYDQYVDVATANPVSNETNVAYAFHFYASEASHEALKSRVETALGRNKAVFVTEWGFSPASGSGTIDQTASQNWLQWLETNNLSSCNWSLSDIDESSAALVKATQSWNDATGGMVVTHNVPVNGPWTDSHLTTSGKLIRDYLRAHNSPYTPPNSLLSFDRAKRPLLYRQGSGLVVEFGASSWNRVELLSADGTVLAAQNRRGTEQQVFLSPAVSVRGVVFVHFSGPQGHRTIPMAWVD